MTELASLILGPVVGYFAAVAALHLAAATAPTTGGFAGSCAECVHRGRRTGRRD